MNINDMYQICQYAINKAQNGYLTPSQFNLLANQAQVSYMDYLLGEFQQYQYGRPQARVNYSQNSDTRQRLTPFIFEKTLTITSGSCLYPSDYLQTDSMRTTDFNRIRFVQQDSLYSYYNSTIDPVATNPVYLLSDTGFQFYPITITSAKLTYVSVPPTMQWGYCLDSNNRPIYNPNPYSTTTSTTSTTSTTTMSSLSSTTTTTGAPSSTTTTTTTKALVCPLYSIQPLWYDVDKLEIIARILKLVGVSLQDGQVQQYANMVTTQGQ
jgi:hypothetical protein